MKFSMLFPMSPMLIPCAHYAYFIQPPTAVPLSKTGLSSSSTTWLPLTFKNPFPIVRQVSNLFVVVPLWVEFCQGILEGDYSTCT